VANSAGGDVAVGSEGHSEHGRWHALDEELEEGDFPLITMVDGKRYELYSDGDLAEVEK